MMVLLSVPSSDLERFLGPPNTRPHPSELFGTRIEILDLEDDRVITSEEYDRSITVIVDAEHVAGYRQDEMGNPFVDVWRIRIIEG